MSAGTDIGWGRASRQFVRRLLQLHIPVVAPTKPFVKVLYWVHVGIRELASAGIRFSWYEPLFRSCCESVGKRFQMERLPYMTGQGRIVIGSDVRLSGKSTFGMTRLVGDEPEFVVGDHTFIGHDCSFEIARSIRIGRHCLIAGGTRMADYDGHPIGAEERRRNERIPLASVRPIVIGDDVWIGSGVRVLKGVTIGDRSVIGAGAVVTHSIPADVIAAGNPARIIRSLA